MKTSQSTWVDVGAESDFALDSINPVIVNNEKLIVVKCRSGLQCYVNECTHQPVPLSDFGEVVGDRLVCHAHGGQFDLHCGGKALCFPVVDDIKTRELKVVENRVLVSG